MKIFISWSGELSHKVARDLKDWLSCVLQGVNSFVSSENIRKGQRWAFEVAKELDESNFGIVCLTKANLSAPWILFEAGALSKSVKETNVSTLLIDDIKVTDITGPLSQFQHTTTSKEDFQKLIETINEQMGPTKLDGETIKKVFDKWWPELEVKIRFHVENANGDAPDFEQRNDSDVLNEILELTRFLAQRSVNPLDFKNILETADSVLRTQGGMLLSPKGGEFNHPVEVKVYPVQISNGEQEEFISVTISKTGVNTSEIKPPFETRGVIILLTFYSETDNQCWDAELEFHEGNIWVQTRMLREDKYEWSDIIWRN